MQFERQVRFPRVGADSFTSCAKHILDAARGGGGRSRRGPFKQRFGNFEQLESHLPLAGCAGLSLESDVGSFIAQGTDVRWIASVDAASNLEYSFRIRSAGTEWSIGRPCDTLLHWVWQTSDVLLDRFHVTVFAREIGSHVSYQAAATPVSIVVGSTEPPSELMINSHQGLIVAAGENYQFSAAVSNVLEHYEYQFGCRESD